MEVRSARSGDHCFRGRMFRCWSKPPHRRQVVKIGLIAIAGVKIQTRKFVNLGITLPQFINRGQVVAQLPSLALLSLAGVTPGGVEVAYIEVDDVEAFARDPRLDFDLVALSTYTARAFDAYLVSDTYRALGVPVVFGGLHATVLPEEVARHAGAVIIGEAETTWPQVVRDFQQGGRPGLKKFYREAKPGSYDLAEAPMPRFDLLASDPRSGMASLPDSAQSGELRRLGSCNRITVQTTRGCPWDRCTLFDLNFRPRHMTAGQLEEGVMGLWRHCWNSQALADRKAHYRNLLRARGMRPGRESADLYYPVPENAQPEESAPQAV